METISSLIPLFVIISIAVSIFNKVKQGQKKSSSTQKTTDTTQRKSLSLQEIIRQQIQEQKKAILGDTTQKEKIQLQPTIFSANSTSTRSSLENTPTEMQRHAHDVHLNEAYNEGDSLNRKTLEGTPTEMQRATQKAHRVTSYNEGDALNRATLEGKEVAEYEDAFDLDEAAKISKVSKINTKSKGDTIVFKFNTNSIVNGIIMSEVLKKRGGKRALR